MNRKMWYSIALILIAAGLIGSMFFGFDGFYPKS
ncbi:hypothetical protein J2Y79_000688 [Bacillus velezensis]|nr:hypothetical protein [Bacillus velezensis]MCP1461210.1 hypothetical protein [Bacillus amyloliquefaciens]MCP1531833.1 hypothetical protein [Bacillus velezensis]MCP1562431.1 hypothetical protein [Bacillus velezensis]